ncbi:MAG: winged helix-turn-helix domain-containing protein [Candidatus Eremiobacteraeota bacterium]|nr:winged helix-turn-helix domain-containing protein [Candidatus Eremiobacteraeota bacterium]
MEAPAEVAFDQVMVKPRRASPQWLYAFGPFRLDPTRRLLTYGSEIIPLPERLYILLLALIQANGNVVGREVLSALIWPDGAPSDGNLSQHIYMLRRVLGERASDRLYVMTAHNKGFRFTAPISVVMPSEAESTREAASSYGDVLEADLNAFNAYSRASYLVEQQHAGALRAAVDYFKDALRAEEEYVPALIGLARAQALLAANFYAPPSVTFPKAKEAIIRALQRAPNSAAAHAVQSNIMLFGDWNWREAKREIDTALRLDSQCPTVFINAIWFHQCVRDDARAMAEIQSALLIEPSAPCLQILFGRVLTHLGRYDRAVAHFSNLIETGPEFALARRYRAQALLLNGQPSDAILDLQLLPENRAEDVASRLPLLARAYAETGDVDRARLIYDSLLAMERTEFVVQWNLAIVAVGLRRYDAALDHLENGVAKREASMPLLRATGWFAPIAKSGRFKALLRAVGF